jgi:hypothetical protein
MMRTDVLFGFGAPLLLFWRPCVPYQRGDEPEQSLLFWAISLTEECSDLDLGNMPSRGPIGLVFDKHAPGIGIMREVPTVSVRAVVSSLIFSMAL